MEPVARLEVAYNSRCQAEVYLSKNNPGRAFAHFLVALNLCPNWKPKLKLKFSSTLCSWGAELENQKRYKDLFHCYEQALEVFPDCEDILNNLGAHLYRLGHVREASHYFRKALMIDPDFLPARRNLQTVSNLVVERWHFRMLNDRLRNEAFREAIFKKVQQKFDNVLDIGTGTGILSMFAAKAGALNVHSCEISPTMYQIANDVIKSNDFAGKINLLNKSSYNVQIPADIPERVSLVVTETMDCGLLGEHVLTILSDAWKRLLLPPCEGFHSRKKTPDSSSPHGMEDVEKESGSNEKQPPSDHNTDPMWNQCFWRYVPGGSSRGHGIVIPFGASVCLAAIECHSLSLRYHLHPVAFIHQHLKFPKTVIASYAGNYDLGDLYDAEDLHQLPGGFRYLGDPAEAIYVNFNDPEEIEARLSGSFPAEVLRVTASSSGRIDAVAAWFILNVDEDIKLVTAPGKGSCWEQAVFPLYPPISVMEGQTIEYTVSNSGKKLAVTAKVVDSTASDDGSSCTNENTPTESTNEDVGNVPLSVCNPTPTSSIGTNENIDCPAGSSHCSESASTSRETSKYVKSPKTEKLNCDLHKLVENFATSTINPLPLHGSHCLPENAIAFLNNDQWIKGMIEAAESVAKNGKIEALLDMSPFPVFGLKMLMMGAVERLVWCTSSNEAQKAANEQILKEVAELNDIKAHKLTYQQEETLQGEFDVIYVDLVDTTGELQEGTIGKLPSLLQMLKPKGILIPERIAVFSQLLFSLWLARMSQVLSDENVCNYKISEFINIYKVSQHLDVDLNALQNDVCCEPVKVLELDVKSLAKGKAAKNCKVVEMKVPKKCLVNAIAHWYEIKLLENVSVCSFGVDSHCKQVATLLPSEVEVTPEEKLLVKAVHYQGLLYFQIVECMPLQEERSFGNE
ncbi:protein arginine N-methyltransferase 9-like [Hetaerina americana]|uniref:protein arginine N-methyltransferase 9-like n=1 Tax=Hetaerina americana TaxID=62018 RepID=UPI003A7F4B6D